MKIRAIALVANRLLAPPGLSGWAVGTTACL